MEQRSTDSSARHFLAHSQNKAGNSEPLSVHLTRVANRAAEFAEPCGAAEEARIAGLLHDLGKYGDLFQRRLEGKEHGIDHWSAGAWEALSRCHLIAAALAIQGHHIGLQQASKSRLAELEPRYCAAHAQPLRVSGTHDRIIERVHADDIPIDSLQPAPGMYSGLEPGTCCASMLDVRLLYSALVDADYIETAAHFDRPSNLPPAPPLSPGVALSILRTHAQSLRTGSNANDTVNDIRSALFAACCHAGAQPTGLFTLTAPTGAGKTLAMLAFALSHALRHGLRRIIVVLPYLTLTEQTATVYETVFGARPELGSFERYVIEDHSLAGTRHVASQEPEEPDLDGAHARGRMGEAPTWDAPVVITTSVQMLESLFASRPKPCRKLHYLPQSVILFDEVQTLPLGLAIPTLATLSHLAERYGSTVVFSTATQPAFSHLDQHVRSYGTAGWAPGEIVPEHRAFSTAMKRRVSVQWPDGEHSTWPRVAEEMLNHGEALCVVNLKRHAAALFSVLSRLDQDGLFHLSTNMCARHRQDVLREVRARLEEGRPCRLVATQCVEAGVDLDFPCVLRALGPLDAIAQAAGRCNRNGKLDLGLVRIFVPEDEGYPDESYQRATSITRALLRASGPEGPNLQDPATYEHYFRTLYDLSQPEKSKEQLLEALRQQDFQEVSRLYRVIPSDAVNVVVPYDQSAFDALASAAAEGTVDWRWMRIARQHSVSIFRPRPEDPSFSHMNSVILAGGAQSEQWFLWNQRDSYDEHTGLVVPTTSRSLIA